VAGDANRGGVLDRAGDEVAGHAGIDARVAATQDALGIP
jgi:hypothetical protein